MGPRSEPIGVILAGGLGRRIGGSKATVKLRGRPLISYPLAAVATALGEVAIIAKPDTKLPDLPGVTVWIEPATPRHPLAGLMHALSLAGDRPVFACAADLPFVTPALVDRIAHADAAGAPAVVAAHRGAMQPLLGCYQPRTIQLLGRAGLGEGVALREAIAAIDPLLFDVDDADELFNVNSPDDLLQAAAMLDRKRLGTAS
jgi:molybdopterin-guanine dinucleotide biosynthesis protein A